MNSIKTIWLTGAISCTGQLASIQLALSGASEILFEAVKSPIGVQGPATKQLMH